MINRTSRFSGIVVFFLIAQFVALNGLAQEQKEISVEDIWGTYQFSTNSVPGFEFMKDGKHYTRLVNSKVVQYDLTTGDQTRILFDTTLVENFNDAITGYTFSKDESKILLQSQTRSIYRRSKESRYVVFDSKSMRITPVMDSVKIQNAQINPAGTKVAFVFENNLYIKDLVSLELIQVTSDGKKNEIINGASDWVYEEEFSLVRAFEWSPDGKYIALLRFDETEVPEFTMTNYNDGHYPDYETFKYPKVGEKNAVVTIHLFDLEAGELSEINVAAPDYEYIPRINWTKDPRFFSFRIMNRWQNRLDLYLVDVRSKNAGAILTEKNPFYLDLKDDLYFLENGKEFIWTSEESGFNHIYLYNTKGEKLKALTNGEYEVTEFLGVDEKRKRVFFQAAMVSPMTREVYSVDFEGNNLINHTELKGNNSARFSHTYDYYIHTFSTANSPNQYLVKSFEGDTIRIIETNITVSRKQVEYNTSPVEFYKFKGPGGDILNGWMIKPKNISDGEKHPVLMFVYGGPGSQQVKDSWMGQNYWWFQMLAQKGYIIACVDNRGTGGRGQDFKKITYLQLGKYETEDQIAAAKHLAKMPFVDRDRIGIFGWSYGGYLANLCILLGNETFKAAISIAPVTNWKWYDTIYTERYMRTDQANISGYSSHAPVYLADKLKGNLLLVHGMGDDNVHFQHTAEFAKELIAANKQFDTYFYPNKSHSIAGGKTRWHLYQKMTDFVTNKL
jgi:dipeptidyl-peptidase 4